MAPTNAIAGPEVHDRGIMQLAPELTIDGPQQDGYSGTSSRMAFRFCASEELPHHI
ncbi:hypothetical protein BAURA63_03655 [Brevibacterium aurantiacum]|uniref:Uncharacterized protein n=1 Tax=Brevibacterium aurantiacum TaxID=273384 RepID=A0A2H1KRT1_BREAU|nr:hypothetical protein BAURA63_03655 [Brevibacterium aurantiacum]